MRFKNLILPIFLILGFVAAANAQDLTQTSSAVSAYRYYKDIDNVLISVPTVLEIPFSTDFIERFDFAVLDKTTDYFEPYYFKQEVLANEIPMSVNTVPNTGGADKMIDKDTQTYADFLLPENVQGQIQITLSSSSPVTSSVLTVLLDDNVALPTFVEIRAFADNQNKIVVANRKMDQQTVRFPQTTSNRWQITFSYSQPLRISELRLNQDNAEKSSIRAIRFLAQPSHSYRIYFDPDRFSNIPVGEAGNLASALDVLVTSAEEPAQNNPDYIIADVDDDGVPDILDNCVSVGNPDQQDINSNGRGDVCDDFDQDGLINSKDNCPNNPNRDQKDTDSDGIGDVCDEQESRITENYPWIPWAGIGFAAIVLIVLFVLTARAASKGRQNNNQ
jgi:hypothetical protein